MYVITLIDNTIAHLVLTFYMLDLLLTLIADFIEQDSYKD